MRYQFIALLAFVTLPGMIASQPVHAAPFASEQKIPGLVTTLDRASIGPKQDDPRQGLTPDPSHGLAIGPKHDDPSLKLKPNPKGLLFIGPKQDDPSPPPQSSTRSILIGL